MTRKNITIIIASFIAVVAFAGWANAQIRPAATPGATPTVTVTVPGPTETSIQRVEVPLETVPPGCTLALEKADEALSLSGDGFQAASDGFNAVSEGDVGALTGATNDMQAIAPKLKAALSAYRDAKGDCR